MVKILICGTHFTPAQAVIEKLRERDWVELVYIGRAYTREGDKTPYQHNKPKIGPAHPTTPTTHLHSNKTQSY